MTGIQTLRKTGNSNFGIATTNLPSVLKITQGAGLCTRQSELRPLINPGLAIQAIFYNFTVCFPITQR